MTRTGEAADLHVHTTASDGTVEVATRIDQAIDRNLSAIAVTDHDRIPASIDEPVATRGGISVIAGTEVRADLFDTKIELLGYFVDPESGSLSTVLERARTYRQDRNRRLVETLRESTTFDRTYAQLRRDVDGNLGRPHVAEALVMDGLAESIGDAFERFLVPGATAYVPMERVPHEDVLEAIDDAGGATSLAHPGRIRSDRVPEMVRELTHAGLDAIEVWYPYDDAPSTEYADIGVEEVRELARDHDLIPTGGSDCHGPGSGKFRLGEPAVDSEIVARLRTRARSTS